MIVKLYDCTITWEEKNNVVRINPVMNNSLYLLKNASGTIHEKTKNKS